MKKPNYKDYRVKSEKDFLSKCIAIRKQNGDWEIKILGRNSFLENCVEYEKRTNRTIIDKFQKLRLMHIDFTHSVSGTVPLILAKKNTYEVFKSIGALKSDTNILGMGFEITMKNKEK